MPVIKQACRPCGVARAGRSRGALVVSARTTPAPSAFVAIAAAAAVVLSSPASATGIESFDVLPASIEKPGMFAKFAEDQKTKLDAVDEAFQKSDTLKALLERSEANKAKNKKEIQNKYCFRQAELGIGDCGGLRFIPGLTEKGKQETPQWLADLLGVEVPPSNQAGGKTLRELIYDEKQ